MCSLAGLFAGGIVLGGLERLLAPPFLAAMSYLVLGNSVIIMLMLHGPTGNLSKSVELCFWYRPCGVDCMAGSR